MTATKYQIRHKVPKNANSGHRAYPKRPAPVTLPHWERNQIPRASDFAGSIAFGKGHKLCGVVGASVSPGLCSTLKGKIPRGVFAGAPAALLVPCLGWFWASTTLICFGHLFIFLSPALWLFFNPARGISGEDDEHLIPSH